MGKNLKNVHLRSVGKDDFDAVNAIREASKLTWRQFFKVLSTYRDDTLRLIQLPVPPSLCDASGVTTTMSLLPLWTANTAENIELGIRAEKDLADCPKTENKSALVIGGGPSLKKYDHLRLLKEHGFNGDIFACSKVLKDCLRAGVVPKYVVFLDAAGEDTEFIDDPIVDEYAGQMTALMAINVHPTTVRRWHGDKYFFIAHIAEWLIPNVAHMFHLFTNKIVMNTTGNTGGACWNLAVYLGYNPIVMIGMDYGFYNKEEMYPYHPDAPRDAIDKTYETYVHPVFGTTCYATQPFQVYKTAHESWIKQMNKIRGTISVNATEGGCLEATKNMPFEEVLKEYGKK